jgi:hypothetical protein
MHDRNQQSHPFASRVKSMPMPVPSLFRMILHRFCIPNQTMGWQVLPNMVPHNSKRARDGSGSNKYIIRRSLTGTIARSFHSRFFGLLSSLLQKQHFSATFSVIAITSLPGRTDHYN